MNNYLTVADGAGFARIEDLERLAMNVENRVIGDLTATRADVCAVVDRIAYIESFGIDELRSEISEIKQALIEVQDMLRSLGMDDIGKRLGDLDTLLA